MKDFFQSIDFENQNTYLKIILFILIANIIGTNIFIPDYFSFELAWRIWTWSLLADIVFIGTMTACLLIPLEMHSRSNSSIRTPVYGIISGIMVYLGYMSSWFFVCLFSNEWTMDDYGWVFYGYWGAISCMLTSMVIMSASNTN